MDLNKSIKDINKNDINREILKMTLRLYSNPQISRKTVNEIVEMFQTFVSETFVPFIQKEIENCVKSISSGMAYFKTQFVLENSKDIFKPFSTEYLRFKIYEEKYSFNPPQLLEIGQESVYMTDDDQNVHVTKKSIYAAHVPLKKTLETFFSSPGVFNMVLQYINELYAEKKFISNVVQGELWNKKYKDLNKIIIPLYLYFDDFETRNPLGSHAGEQKLGGVYISIASLPPHISAKMKNIFLSTIFHSDDLKNFGNKKIFQKLIEELNILSDEGIIINVEGTDKKIYFQCIQILGDNLGLNKICGFSESFIANRFCRICTATKEQCQKLLEEDEHLLRDVKSYEKVVAEEKFADSGLKEKCIFNDIKNFHICENISVDVMHDILEGVASYTIAKVIHEIISSEKITLATINNKIDSFSYGTLETSNKPRPLFYAQGKKGAQKLKVKQSAAEMQCLVRYLGLMIGDIVPDKNPHWKLYLCLRKIFGVVASPSLDKGQIQNLKELIRKHNKLYFQLNGKLKPKMHFLLHYVTVMILNGPVIHYSAMKYERKNKQLKEIAVSTTSNINLPLTIAIKHQLQLCYATAFSLPIQSDIELGSIDNSDAHNYLKKFIPNLRDGISVTTLKNIELLGISLSPGTVFVSRITENGPCFGVIKKIFYCKNVYFEAEELEVLFFDHHYHAYCVQYNVNPTNLLINVDLIPKTSPCLLVKKRTNIFVATRYDI
ncbi:uncharacterized protein LOC127289825 [Leptopilina boulardi]|uniref:uncharacterized protein LOC127289825 n=1 Tax=Leptopilina boulardi TaxID=63433 RepID=UPI0021F5047D|nr:uncharacterized protein LOC127289825 [Leptopilina boulardi]